jgi:hypothetical protein
MPCHQNEGKDTSATVRARRIAHKPTLYVDLPTLMTDDSYDTASLRPWALQLSAQCTIQHHLFPLLPHVALHHGSGRTVASGGTTNDGQQAPAPALSGLAANLPYGAVN